MFVSVVTRTASYTVHGGTNLASTALFADGSTHIRQCGVLGAGPLRLGTPGTGRAPKEAAELCWVT